MVLGVLGALVGVTKVRYSNTVVDSKVFRLHYHWTTYFCLISAALVMAVDFVGDPIQCMVGKSAASKAITTYCWIASTFTINSTGPMPGVGPHTKHHEKTFHAYYQWVPAVLCFQATLFSLPHFIWKCIEGKQVDGLLQDLNKNLIDDDAEKKRKNIIQYIKETWGMNVRYALGYFVCEVLNLVNVVGQMFLIDKFLGGIFLNFGLKVFKLLAADDQQRNDPILETFPRIAKCTFRQYGASGTIERHDALCVLPQNIINEKIYFVMWIWFIFLTIATSLQILWRLVLFSSNFLRVRLIGYRAKMAVPLRLEQAVRHMHLGDYFLLDCIGQNLDYLHFRDILNGVAIAAEEVSPSAAPNGSYKPMYPSPEVETLPRKRHLDQPDCTLIG